MKLCIILLSLFLPLVLNAQDNSFYHEFLDQISEDVFLSPHKKEETEIVKRVEEKNQEEIKLIRTSLKHYFRNNDQFSQIKRGESRQTTDFLRILEGFPNLGGLLWYSKGNLIFQWGDWSDFYEDGLSLNKIRNEGQIPSFIYEEDQFYFFVRNSSGYFPVEFQFLGFESTFYVFGDDGFLRYTNDSEMDLAMRVTEFRKIFETIRSKIPDTSEIKTGDLSIYIVPGKNRPLYYALYSLRLFLYLWASYLFFIFFRSTFPFLKKHLPKNPIPPI